MSTAFVAISLVKTLVEYVYHLHLHTIFYLNVKHHARILLRADESLVK
jgi:serine phosphatase RsbU (regulator of sigma subunit)